MGVSGFCMASNATQTEYDFVLNVETPLEEHKFCPITFELLKDPRQTISCCGHHLSRAATKHLEAEGKPCPLCRNDTRSVFQAQSTYVKLNGRVGTNPTQRVYRLSDVL